MQMILQQFVKNMNILDLCYDDHDHGCHDCHIAYMETGGKIQVELGEFCDDDLENIEANGYTLAEDVVVGDVTIPAGFYPASDIHCGEHHDDHEPLEEHFCPVFVYSHGVTIPDVLIYNDWAYSAFKLIASFSFCLILFKILEIKKISLL